MGKLFGSPRHWGKGSKNSASYNGEDDEEYEESEATYDPYYDDMSEQEWYDKHPLAMPDGCRACGGAYPMCKSSCPLFDDDD